MVLWSAVAAVIILIDRLTKYLAVKNIPIGKSFSLIPNILDFTYVRNTGAAFSMLSEHTWLLSIISVAFCVAVILYFILKKPKNKLLNAALALIFAGAFGNALDRIFMGSVVDFIEITFIRFPVFNVADISVFIGTVMLAVYILFFDTNKKEEK